MKKSTFISLFLLACLYGHAQQAKVYTTTGSRSQELKESYVDIQQNAQGSSVLMLMPEQRNQSMDGFGFAITYSTCYNLLKMSQSDRTALLKRTFSPTEGYGVNYVRISIGCNDFSSTEYTLCDKQGLENFALYKDETDYVIPVLKEIQAINPDLLIIGAPWTPPRWMKTNGKWTDGNLKAECRQDYADYFVKFVQAFKANGIDIYAVSPQNEPLNAGNCASLVMPWDQEADFIKVLAPTFKRNGLKTKIYVWDHNYNYDGQSDQNHYPIKCYDRIGDCEGSELVVGAAYHNYDWPRNPKEMTYIHNQRPDKELIFTEGSIGTWSDGHNLDKSLMEQVEAVGMETTLNWARAAIVWNFMLDDKRGPNLDGGCQTCYGAVDIKSSNYRDYTFNSQYFAITHMSSVIKRGAVRIGTSGWKGDGITCAAFRNPDRSMAVVILNTSSSSYNPSISDGENYCTVNIPGRSVVSVTFASDVEEKPAPTFNGTEMQGASDGYGYTGLLEQGKTYKIENSTVMNSSTWYSDPDYFVRQSDGSYKFIAKTGNYNVTANLSLMYFQVTPTQSNKYSTSTGDGDIWVIGEKIGKPTYANGAKWTEGSSKNFRLSPIADKKYQLTLTIGEQVDPSKINFKFFHQNGWGGEFKGSSSSSCRIICNDEDFGVGTGSDGHDDGNIYLKGSVNVGETYVFTLDTTNPTAAVLTVKKDSGETTSIRSAQATVRGQVYYDLQGRPIVSPNSKGIYIQDGKKHVVR